MGPAGVLLATIAAGAGIVRDPGNRIVNFEQMGGIPGDTTDTVIAVHNAALLNATLSNLTTGDTLLVPNATFMVMGGIVGANLAPFVSLRIDGTLKFSDDIKAWPTVPGKGKLPVVALTFTNTTGLMLTSAGTGTLDGNGAKWWGIPGIGYLERGKNRPPLLSMQNATGMVLERLLLLNSPRFHFISRALRNATIRYSHVSARRTANDGHSADDLTAFNTDGFDVSGRDIHIHDCSVWNQDDTFAIKANDEDTSNVLVERVSASGVGLTIGSIGGKNNVRNVTFRDVRMHHTSKGIYIKFRGHATGTISDVLYENIVIDKPESWPIWIGPAQQGIKESTGPYNPCHGDPCSLCWPNIKSANCDSPPGLFENITLRNITINNPSLSPGVLFGNTSLGNGIKGLVFDSVRFTNPPANGVWGKDYYYCKGVVGAVAIGDTWPVPPCFANRTGAQSALR